MNIERKIKFNKLIFISIQVFWTVLLVVTMFFVLKVQFEMGSYTSPSGFKMIYLQRLLLSVSIIVVFSYSLVSIQRNIKSCQGCNLAVDNRKIYLQFLFINGELLIGLLRYIPVIMKSEEMEK